MRFLTSLVISASVSAAEGLRADRLAFVALLVAVVIEVAVVVGRLVVAK